MFLISTKISFLPLQISLSQESEELLLYPWEGGFSLIAAMDTELSDQFYRIQAVDRARKIPSVNYLWDKSTKVYGRVKGANTFVNWAFDTVESMVNVMIEKSLPVARLIEKPIYTLDKTLCQGIDFVEVKLPIIKEEPKQVMLLFSFKCLGFESAGITNILFHVIDIKSYQVSGIRTSSSSNENFYGSNARD